MHNLNSIPHFVRQSDCDLSKCPGDSALLDLIIANDEECKSYKQRNNQFIEFSSIFLWHMTTLICVFGLDTKMVRINLASYIISQTLFYQI